MKALKPVLPLLVTAALITACAPPGGSSSENGNPACPQGTTNCTQGPTPDPSASASPTPAVSATPTGNDKLKSVDSKGYVRGGNFDERLATEISTVNASLLVHVWIPTVLTSANGPLSSVAGGTYSVTKDGTYSYVTVSLPISRLFDGSTLGGTAGLPNGNNLPGIPEGRISHLALSTGTSGAGSFGLDLYLADNRFAVFVSTPNFNPGIDMANQVKNLIDNLPIGTYATINKSGASSGGFYVSLVYPDAMAAKIREAVKNP